MSYITGKFAITFTNASQDAAWVFQTEEEARSHAFSGEGRFELWEGLSGDFEYDTRNGALSAPMDRELLEAWEYYDEDEGEEWAVRHTITGKFYVGIEGPEVIFGLDGPWKGRKEIAEEICDLLEGEAGIELLEVIQVKGVGDLEEPEEGPYAPIETRPCLDGVQRLFKFENGYGASVVCHNHSYGGKEGLWELAVLKDGQICYDTEVTGDVEGWLDEDDVQKLLRQVAGLPRESDSFD